MKWWEKTVEYFFVKKYLSEKAIVPLAGKEERAGDAILCGNEKFILIEFKRDKASLCTEKDKFIDYEKAKSALSDEDSHHLLIYGINSEQKFSIKAITYFSQKSYSSIGEALAAGKPKDEFDQYLKKFLKFKNQKSVDGNGSLSTELFYIVAAIDQHNNIVSCCSLAEYIESVLQHNISKNGPSSPMKNLKGPSPPGLY